LSYTAMNLDANQKARLKGEEAMRAWVLIAEE
jgi:hypothetical protein